MELTLKADYLPTWGLFEGVRELIQNAKDAEVQLNAPMCITWLDDTLYINNHGCTIPKEALLFGHTTKSNTSLIGKHGEGVKGGILALVRAGYQVDIFNGNELWQGSIKWSTNFNANVLCFDFYPAIGPTNEVSVQIKGITKEQYEELIPHFIFLNDVHCHVTTYGSILFDPYDIGKIYVKGIYVCKLPGYEFGYDLYQINLDRDRNKVSAFDAKQHIHKIWMQAIKQNPDLIITYLDLLDKQTEEVESITSWSLSNLDDFIVNQVYQRFVDDYGENAFPVDTAEQAVLVGHYSKIGIVVPKSLGMILRKTFGTIDQLYAMVENNVCAYYQLADLTLEEFENLYWVDKKLSVIEKVFNINLVQVVDFVDVRLRGLCYMGDKIQIARWVLTDRYLLLQVCIHELSHYLTEAMDGDKMHISYIEALWTSLVRNKGL